MADKYIYLISGIIIGWVTKFPLLVKWYRELKRTKDYKKMKDAIHYQEMKDRYNEMYPKKPLA